ncbi:MAG: hypothetical protein E7632_08610 [Ruminococcaceae bacterium]|nr:hypothetical protein [Oscillospiraceae bacterium]
MRIIIDMNNNRQPNNQGGRPQNPIRPPQNGQRPQNPGRPPQNPPRQTPQGARPNPARQTQARPAQAGQRPQQNAPQNPLNRHTPSSRRAEPKRVKLTAEQMEINRTNRQRERYYIKKQRGAALRTFFVRFLVFVVTFILLAILTTALFFLNLTRKDSTDSSRYSYVIGDEKYSLSYTQAVVDGRVYVSFTDVAEMLGLAVTGSPEDIKYVIKSEESETIRFVTDSRTVYVNGVETRLSGESFYSGEDLYVPVDFVSAYFKGLTVTHDERAHKITIEREITNLGENGKVPKGEEAVYGELSFLLQSQAAMGGIDEMDVIEATMPDLGFVTNLGIYEQYMNPGNTTEYLALVNTENRLAANYVPQDLIAVADTRDDGRQTQMMREYAAMALEAMFRELRAAGFEDVSVTSAYRSYSYQESVFTGYVQNEKAARPELTDEEAKARVMEYSQPAGASEHQTGLCADMHSLPSADVAFGDTDAFKWLKANCWKFGFILRFPQNTKEITGISYEPWHYRYVGRYHAQRITEMGITLEEYWDYLKSQQG